MYNPQNICDGLVRLKTFFFKLLTLKKTEITSLIYWKNKIFEYQWNI